MTRPLYDFSLFNNEFEMLDLRLKYMRKFVNIFFVSESNITYQGEEKPYHSETFIKYYPVACELMNSGRLFFIKTPLEKDGAYFSIEKHHRASFSQWALNNLEGDFHGILCDCDEIVDEKIKDFLEDTEIITSLGLKMFYFAANNCSHKQSWSYVKLFRSSILTKTNFQKMRVLSAPKHLPDMGWHFSSFGGISQILNKLQSFSHTEFNNENHVNSDIMIKRIISREDYLGRSKLPCSNYDITSFPDPLRSIIIDKPLFHDINNILSVYDVR